MRSYRLFSLLIGLFVLISACTTVQSTKAPEWTEKIDDVFVIINPGSSFMSFGNGVKDNLQKRFQQLNVKSEIVVPTGLELEDTLRQQMTSRNYLLTITLTEGTVSAGWVPIQVGGNYDVVLFSVSSDLSIWRANLKMQNNYGISAGTLADKVIATLQKDGLLDPAKSTE